MADWLLLQNGLIVYVAIFLMLFSGAIGLPIPEDIPLILAGIAAQRQSVNLEIVFLVCYFGVLVGDLIIFTLGKKFGPAIFQKEWVKSRITSQEVSNLKLKLERRSLLMIFVARHLFYLRTMTFLTCGAVNMSYKRFILSDALAALISIPIMLTLGYVFAEHYDRILIYIKEAKFWSLLLIVAVVTIFIVYKKYKCSSYCKKSLEK